jgi:hypothetical protein
MTMGYVDVGNVMSAIENLETWRPLCPLCLLLYVQCGRWFGANGLSFVFGKSRV